MGGSVLVVLDKRDEHLLSANEDAFLGNEEITAKSDRSVKILTLISACLKVYKTSTTQRTSTSITCGWSREQLGTHHPRFSSMYHFNRHLALGLDLCKLLVDIIDNEFSDFRESDIGNQTDGEFACAVEGADDASLSVE